MGKSKATFKDSILSRYTEEYQRGTISTANCRKTSQEIILELRPLADFSTNDISEYLITKGYEIDFDGDIPVWLLIQKTLELGKIEPYWDKL
jgi:hypothetical protein